MTHAHFDVVNWCRVSTALMTCCGSDADLVAQPALTKDEKSIVSTKQSKI
jgi:hypothetical protein